MNTQNTLDDLQAAFTRLEQRTPHQIDTLPTVAPTEATVVAFVGPNRRPRRAAALVGAGLGVAATITVVAVVATSSGSASPRHAPAGGSDTCGPHIVPTNDPTWIDPCTGKPVVIASAPVLSAPDSDRYTCSSPPPIPGQPNVPFVCDDPRGSSAGPTSTPTAAPATTAVAGN